MRAMAFLTGRSIGIILTVKLSVGATYILLANFIVARGAVHSTGDGFARPNAGGVYFRVALAAGNLAVARMAHLTYVDEHRLPIARPAQLLIRVAMHAVRVSHTLGIENVSDLVWLVAIHAGRQDVGFLFPQRSPNDLPVDGFDLRVAFGAGGGNVPSIN